MEDTIPCFECDRDFPSAKPEELRPFADWIRSARNQGREMRILYGGAKGIYVHSNSEGLELRLPTVVWHGPHDPAPSLTIWKKLHWNEVDEVGLENLLAQALEARRQEFRRCRFCREEVPLEHRHDDRTCHGCAEKYLGVVH